MIFLALGFSLCRKGCGSLSPSAPTLRPLGQSEVPDFLVVVATGLRLVVAGTGCAGALAFGRNRMARTAPARAIPADTKNAACMPCTKALRTAPTSTVE